MLCIGAFPIACATGMGSLRLLGGQGFSPDKTARPSLRNSYCERTKRRGVRDTFARNARRRLPQNHSRPGIRSALVSIPIASAKRGLPGRRQVEPGGLVSQPLHDISARSPAPVASRRPKNKKPAPTTVAAGQSCLLIIGSLHVRTRSGFECRASRRIREKRRDLPRCFAPERSR